LLEGRGNAHRSLLLKIKSSSFCHQGGGVVHLTGYLTEEPDFEMPDDEESESESEELDIQKNKKVFILSTLQICSPVRALVH
jgi:hypothetical protein